MVITTNDNQFFDTSDTNELCDITKKNEDSFLQSILSDEDYDTYKFATNLYYCKNIVDDIDKDLNEKKIMETFPHVILEGFLSLLNDNAISNPDFYFLLGRISLWFHTYIRTNNIDICGEYHIMGYSFFLFIEKIRNNIFFENVARIKSDIRMGNDITTGNDINIKNDIITENDVRVTSSKNEEYKNYTKHIHMLKKTFEDVGLQNSFIVKQNYTRSSLCAYSKYFRVKINLELVKIKTIMRYVINILTNQKPCELNFDDIKPTDMNRRTFIELENIFKVIKDYFL